MCGFARAPKRSNCAVNAGAGNGGEPGVFEDFAADGIGGMERCTRGDGVYSETNALCIEVGL